MNYWIWFAQIDGVGPIQKRALLAEYGTPEKIFKAEIDKDKSINPKLVENIEKSKDLKLIDKYEKYIDKYNIKVINITDDTYPQALKEIYNPPITLFAKGDLSILGKKSVAIVGCRDASNYGLKTARQLSYNIAKDNIVIVSGLAKGIDAMGHLGALEANGKTIAVLGCGVDICYPKENIEIYKKILENGLILSEFIVGTTPKPENFPIRNRIVSGLSNGVIVVEAKKKSGSLITADLALEQGREVYVLPGNINSAQSYGTNELIKQGAKLITCARDVLEDM